METQQDSKAEERKTVPTVRDERVYLGLPAYGGVIHAPFASCMMELICTDAGVAKIEFYNGDSLVCRARNKLAGWFHNGRPAKDAEGNEILVQYDWLLFIDTDLIFNPRQVANLIKYAKAHGPNIYCGAYPLKTIKPRVVFNAMPGCQRDADGVLEVREAGTGMMLIHRDVFTKLIEAFGDEITYEADSGSMSQARAIENDFFRVGVRFDPILKYKRYLSEDWYFCQLWREIGGKVLMHTTTQCGHIGSMTYPPNPKEILEAAEIYKKAAEHETQMKRAKELVAMPAPVVPVIEKVA